jgi:predicted amidohydrolase
VNLAKIALMQVATTDGEEIPARITRVVNNLEQTLKTQVKLAMLPELWASGAFKVSETKHLAKEITDNALPQIKDLAKKYKTWIHAGSYLEQTSTGIYNTSYLFDDRGELVSKYRKIHLFGFDEGEAAELLAGSEVVVIPTPIGITGLATCYDLRFPELFRAMVQKGANSFLITSGWPEKRITHWNALLKARAIENQAFVIACNGTGDELGGESQVIDPWGVNLSSLSRKEDVLFENIDLQLSNNIREKMPFLEDRVIT